MTILVIGDYIVDEYWIGTSDRISPEAPVPVVTKIKPIVRAGGAANVALNIQAMGSTVELITQAAANYDQSLIESLKSNVYPCEITPTKTRIVANDHAICRIDNEQYQPLIPEKKWFDRDISICVLSDYNKGVLDNSNSIINWCNELNIKTIVDPKKTWDNYQGCWLLKANAKELEQEIGRQFETSELDTICQTLSIKHSISNIIITLGNKGMFVWTADTSRFISSWAKLVVDVTGSGDVVIAALAHYTINGYDLFAAAERATKLASIGVEKFGCYTVTQDDLIRIESKVVFTNGCFDILHKGHLDYLQKSRNLGTRLVVGLNSDQSIKRLKGPARPINNEHDRKLMLESLECVDEVIVFDEDTPRELIKQLKLDIITKGGDYSVDQVVGNDLVNQVIIIPLVEGYSTTQIINRLNKND